MRSRTAPDPRSASGAPSRLSTARPPSRASAPANAASTTASIAAARIGIASVGAADLDGRVDVGRIEGLGARRERDIVEAVGRAERVGLRQPAARALLARRLAFGGYGATEAHGRSDPPTGTTDLQAADGPVAGSIADVTLAEDSRLVTLDEIRAAAERIAGIVVRTPLLPFRRRRPSSSPRASSRPARSRSAAPTTRWRSSPPRSAPAASSPTRAATTPRRSRARPAAGHPRVVVMPNNAPGVKVAGVRADGAEIVFVGPHNEERVARAHEIADATAWCSIPSANDTRVVAGQGTIGLEIVEQLAELGVDGGADRPRAGRPGRAGCRRQRLPSSRCDPTPVSLASSRSSPPTRATRSQRAS